MTVQCSVRGCLHRQHQLCMRAWEGGREVLGSGTLHHPFLAVAPLVARDARSRGHIAS